MRTSKKWLDAQCEHHKSLKTFSSCLSLCDLKCDNYYKLIAAEVLSADPFQIPPRLKVFKGTSLISEQSLPGIPSAVANLYIDDYEPKIPVIAVSIGPSILFYRNMKPYYKYTLPSMPIDQKEQDIWKKLPNEKPTNLNSLIEQLKLIGFKQLTETSLILIHMETIEEQQNFIRENENKPLVRLSTITAMTTIQKASSTDNCGISYLILATEDGDVIFLNVQSFSIVHQARVNSFVATPSMLSVTGYYDIDFRLIISTREGTICILRKDWLEGKQIIKVDNPVLGLSLLPIDQTIIVVCMNKSLDCYSKKGKRLWTVELPERAMCMVPVEITHTGQTLICVGLHGGIVQLYLQKNLVDQFTVSATVSAMIFGKLGQEDHCLVLITIDGYVTIKILKRTAEFIVPDLTNSDEMNSEINTTSTSGNLQIPKKTKVFVEQMIRERQNAPDIYRNFQSEMWRLRLTAARSTVDIINSAETTISAGDIGHVPIKLSAEVLGLGPIFRLFLCLENLAARREAGHVAVLLHANCLHYTLERPIAKIPCLVPGVPIKIDFKVTAILDEHDGLPPSDLTPENSIVRVLVIKTGQAKPLIAATVAMPAPEPLANNIY